MYTAQQALDYLTPSPDCRRILDVPPDPNASTALRWPIPVWSFWTGKPSETVALCHKSWRTHLPRDKYDIRILDDERLSDWIDTSHPCFDSPNAALKSDYIRIELLWKYGGIWMDSSVLLLMGFHEWEMLDKPDDLRCFSAFYNDRNMSRSCSFPIVETSCMVAPPGHALIGAWRDRLQRIADGCARPEFDKYFDENDSGALQRKNLFQYYHIVYHMLQHALHYYGGVEEFRGVHLYKGTHADFQFLAARADAPLRGASPPLIKLVADDRKRADAMLRSGTLPKNSPLHRFVSPKKRRRGAK